MQGSANAPQVSMSQFVSCKQGRYSLHPMGLLMHLDTKLIVVRLTHKPLPQGCSWPNAIGQPLGALLIVDLFLAAVYGIKNRGIF